MLYRLRQAYVAHDVFAETVFDIHLFTQEMISTANVYSDALGRKSSSVHRCTMRSCWRDCLSRFTRPSVIVCGRITRTYKCVYVISGPPWWLPSPAFFVNCPRQLQEGTDALHRRIWLLRKARLEFLEPCKGRSSTWRTVRWGLFPDEVFWNVSRNRHGSGSRRPYRFWILSAPRMWQGQTKRRQKRATHRSAANAFY